MLVKIVENEQELSLAYAVRKKVFVEEQGVPEHLELDEHDASATHFIVKDEDKTIAAARLREMEPKIGKVERVCVLKEYRGKRLGLLIMKEIEHYAKNHDFKKLKLNAQSYAVPFYEKLDYKVTSPEFLDAGIPHRAMEKEL
ncbi:GNAT family N-acetyltransferase [Lysinibacillus yapensis]|uniref:GNAT family N-acetyltransferase n=1 Tax=Ureibacillus yapensis TaxID=2304605 RepID=A0A396SDR3_9BACL|nr:GNAT family N-acetyltransferase [Lysinibacillus yapensis]RHW39843.1 GNAT family N-acetyltransferase [Lysinibacillus yapensis]